MVSQRGCTREEKGHFVLRRKPQERLGRTGFFPQCGSPRSVSTLVGLGPLRMGCRHVTDRASVVGPTLLSLHDPTTRLHSARSGLHACIECHRQAPPDPPCFTLGEACRHVERCGTVTVACQYGGHAQRVAAVQVPPSHVPPSYNLQVPPSHVVPEFNQSRSGAGGRGRERERGCLLW